MDGIPHVAFMTKDAKVLTALVGAVPGSILNSDIAALVTVSCVENLNYIVSLDLVYSIIYLHYLD